MSNIDERIQKLFNTVNERRAEIESIKNGQYETNASFSPNENATGGHINLNTVQDVTVLVRCLAQLIATQANYDKAVKTLGAPKSKFKHQGYTFKQWEHDFKLRAQRIMVKAKKDELAELEATLETLVSPEVRRELELQRVEKALAK